MKPILTAKVGNNADLFPDVLAIYAPKGGKALDMTWGKGVFWRKVDLTRFDLIRNDIDPALGDTHYDFRHLPEEWNSSFDLVVLDPPYASRSGSPIPSAIDRAYNNRKRVDELHVFGVDAMMRFYDDGMRQTHRVLRPRGILVVKCMDEVMGGKQYAHHATLISLAVCGGFLYEDLFVLVQTGTPTMRHDHQVHARKNHSYFLVFRKPRGGG